jgi:hypothetical protein
VVLIYVPHNKDNPRPPALTMFSHRAEGHHSCAHNPRAFVVLQAGGISAEVDHILASAADLTAKTKV